MVEYRTEECRRINPWVYEDTCYHKPLSINAAYYMNKKKTKAYTEYERAWAKVFDLACIPEDHIENVKDMYFAVEYIWGFSNNQSDVDNPIKTTTDIMQNHFGFNDKQIRIVKATKLLVPKGSEYAHVKIREVFLDDLGGVT